MVSLIGEDTGPLESVTTARFGSISTAEPIVGRTVQDYWEFRGEGIYMKVLRDLQSVSLAYDVLGLLKRQIAQQSENKKSEGRLQERVEGDSQQGHPRRYPALPEPHPASERGLFPN